MFEGHVLVAAGQFLSKRQQDVWRLCALSETTKGIALAMKLSTKTVEYHRARLMSRLGKYDYAALTREAIAVGLIDCGRSGVRL